MAQPIANSIELQKARLDERGRRGLIGKERDFLSKCERSVFGVVDSEMRNKKAIHIVFDDQVALENSPKRVVI